MTRGGVATGVNGQAGINGQTGTAAQLNANGTTNNTAAGVGATGGFTANGISPTPFFNDPGARQQLNMNPNQYRNLNRAYQNAYGRYNRALRNLNPNLTAQQRAERLQQLQSQFNQQLSSTLNGTFTNPQAMARYNQLNRQFMGFNAFNNPTIQRELNLSPDQLRQIRTLANNWRQQLQQFRQGAGNNLNTVDMNQWNRMWMQYQNQLNGILTPQQQQIWAQQIGQPFVFSPSVFMPSQSGFPGQEVSPNPTVPKYVPNSNAAQGTQPSAGTRSAANPGNTTPGTQGGTVR